MAAYFRKRRTLRLPITLSVVLMSLNVALMVCWIVLLAQRNSWSYLTIGTIVFALILVGLIAYTFFTIKEHRLNQRQANFVDSVTHELKSPIASLRLYLETLEMRSLDDTQRAEFYSVMDGELRRLDDLISQLLEVGKLGTIGQTGHPEDVPLEPLLRRCAETACKHYNCGDDAVFLFDVEPAAVNARPMLLEMIFRNLMDNSVKYAGVPPRVEVKVRLTQVDRVAVQIIDNGEGVPAENRKKIFRIFVRGGSELERKRTGTGLGLYIVRTLVHLLKGKVRVYDRDGRSGSVFEVQLPGKAARHADPDRGRRTSVGQGAEV
jgi:signal transduction histidine kinase